MTDTLRQDCEAVLAALGYGGGEECWPKEYLAVMSFARAQQASGLREAAVKYAEWINGHEFLECPRFEDWCEAQATAREKGQS